MEGAASVATARGGNVLGGGDWTPGQLVPDTMAALSARRPVALRHPDAVRPWQHVLDCLGGYLMLAEKLHGDVTYSGAWDFGPPDSECVPVAELVEGLAARLCVSPAWARDSGAYAPEETLLRLDSTKAAELLDWRPALPLQTALDWVVDWYRAFARGADPAELCREQIAEHSTARSMVGSRDKSYG